MPKVRGFNNWIGLAHALNLGGKQMKSFVVSDGEAAGVPVSILTLRARMSGLYVEQRGDRLYVCKLQKVHA